MTESSPGDPGQSGAPSTRDLLERIERDPDLAWTDLLRRSESKLRVLLHFRMPEQLRGVCDEDDLLQDVWAEAARKLVTFEYRGPGSLHRWLAGILQNKMLHAGRSSVRVPSKFSEVASGTGSGGARFPALLKALEETQPGASTDARRRELEDTVRHVLADLPVEQRQAILLKIYEGLSGREAAIVEGVDESTISIRYKQAIQTCAIRLKGIEL